MGSTVKPVMFDDDEAARALLGGECCRQVQKLVNHPDTRRQWLARLPRQGGALRLVAVREGGLAFARLESVTVAASEWETTTTGRGVAALAMLGDQAARVDSFDALSRLIDEQRPKVESVAQVMAWLEQTGVAFCPDRAVDVALLVGGRAGPSSDYVRFATCTSAPPRPPADPRAAEAWREPTDDGRAITLFANGADGGFYQVTVDKADGRLDATRVCAGAGLDPVTTRHARTDPERDEAYEASLRR